jgi:hypothetical protein
MQCSHYNLGSHFNGVAQVKHVAPCFPLKKPRFVYELQCRRMDKMDVLLFLRYHTTYITLLNSVNRISISV